MSSSSSWFSSFDPNDAIAKLSEISSKVQETVNETLEESGALDAIKESVAVVSSATTTSTAGDSNRATTLLQNLTLNSPDMIAERTQMDMEERRKEYVKHYLSELLPWETYNEELEICVDDCKEAILKLSNYTHSFLVPYQLDDVVLFSSDQDNIIQEEIKTMSLKHLQAIQPLPSLLGSNFDLDAHVGLIERLLDIDPILKQQHANLSGAGEKEFLFWRNYFFHCAYTRYEKGLPIEEIWERKPEPLTTKEFAVQEAQSKKVVSAKNDVENESIDSVELTFEEEVVVDEEARTTPQPSNATMIPKAIATTTVAATAVYNNNNNNSQPSSVVSSGTTSYEILDNDSNGGGVLMDTAIIGSTTTAITSNMMEDSDELDDLEAEIARELEDD